MPAETVSLAPVDDGGVVAYLDGGDPAGAPVIGLHGTPGCRFSRWPDDGLYARAGVRYVTLDRAGYGRSTRRPGRRVADVVTEVVAVADALGLERFAVVGGSGGGPHALACAALLADRVTRVACQSSLAPVGTGGMSRRAWTDGMGAEFAVELTWADEGEDRLTREWRRVRGEMATALEEDPTTLLGEGLSDGDVAFLAREDLRDNWRRIIAEQMLEGVGGAVDDTLALTRPWGFNLALVDRPVLVTHGAQDVSCPPAHGRWIAARVRGSELRISDTGGHLPEHPEAEITETMAWLRG